MPLWQVSQGSDVGMCVVADLPLAVEPLWHEAQPEVTAGWTNVAPRNVVVDLWHVSHGDEVTTCFVDLPLAPEAVNVPLWQVAQPVAIVMFLCTTAARKLVVLLWQVLQVKLVGTWVVAGNCFATVKLLRWQVAQAVATTTA